MTIPFHLPRCHRRPLLFPPGLLALAWLLWLGSMALPQIRGFRPEYVMQLTMPEYYPPLRSPLPLLQPVWEGPSYMSPLEIEAFRPWQDAVFTGSPWIDYFSTQQIQATLHQCQADPSQVRGLRIRFMPQARYASLILVLDLFEAFDMKRYWWDIRPPTTTMYMFTVKPSTYYVAPLCGGMTLPDVVPTAPASAFANGIAWLVALVSPATYAPLLQPDWRNSIYLLLLLAGLTMRKMVMNAFLKKA